MTDADFEKLQQTVNLHAQRLDKFEGDLKENTRVTNSIYENTKLIVELQKGLVDGTKLLCRIACAVAWLQEKWYKILLMAGSITAIWHWGKQALHDVLNLFK